MNGILNYMNGILLEIASEIPLGILSDIPVRNSSEIRFRDSPPEIPSELYRFLQEIQQGICLKIHQWSFAENSLEVFFNYPEISSRVSLKNLNRTSFRYFFKNFLINFHKEECH